MKKQINSNAEDEFDYYYDHVTVPSNRFIIDFDINRDAAVHVVLDIVLPEELK